MATCDHCKIYQVGVRATKTNSQVRNSLVKLFHYFYLDWSHFYCLFEWDKSLTMSSVNLCNRGTQLWKYTFFSVQYILERTGKIWCIFNIFQIAMIKVIIARCFWKQQNNNASFMITLGSWFCYWFMSGNSRDQSIPEQGCKSTCNRTWSVEWLKVMFTFLLAVSLKATWISHPA